MADGSAAPTHDPNEDSYLNSMRQSDVIDEPPPYQHPSMDAPPADTFEAAGDVTGELKSGETKPPEKPAEPAAAAPEKPAEPEKPAPPKSPFEDVQHAGDYDPTKPAAEEPPAEPAAAPAGRAEKKRERYEDIVKRASTAEEQLAEERRTRLARDAEIEELRRGTAPAAPAAPAPATAAAAEPKPADPAAELSPKPKEEDFDTTEEWSRKLDEWYTAKATSDVKAQVDQQIAANREQSEQQAREATERRSRSEVDALIQTNVEHFRKHPKAQDMATALSAIQSPWYEPLQHGEDKAKSLTHFTTRNPKGGEALVFLGENPQKAQALANLSGHPERHPGHVRAWVNLTAVVKNPVGMLDFMSTETGGRWFEALGTLPEPSQLVEIGSMEGRLAAVPASSTERGGGPAAGRVSNAPPPVTPPRGTSGTPAPGSRLPKEFDGSQDSEPYADAEFQRRMNSRFKAAAGAPAATRPARRVIEHRGAA